MCGNCHCPKKKCGNCELSIEFHIIISVMAAICASFFFVLPKKQSLRLRSVCVSMLADAFFLLGAFNYL